MARGTRAYIRCSPLWQIDGQSHHQGNAHFVVTSTVGNWLSAPNVVYQVVESDTFALAPIPSRLLSRGFQGNGSQLQRVLDLVQALQGDGPTEFVFAGLG
jgi:hypothetical protein